MLFLWPKREAARVWLTVCTRAALAAEAVPRISPSGYHGEDRTCVHLAGL